MLAEFIYTFLTLLSSILQPVTVTVVTAVIMSNMH